LDPHDLAIAKYAAGREKDVIFNRELVARGIVTRQRLFDLLQVTPVDETKQEQIRAAIERDFGQL
jgi:hypothetical protein